MYTKGNRVYYKDQVVKFNMTDRYYFIDTDQGMKKIAYCPEEDRWHEGLTVDDKKSFQYREATPAFVMAHGGWFLRLQNPEEKNLIRSLKILRNLNADCAHVQYKQDSSSDVNDQASVLSKFCGTLSPETLDYFNRSLAELCYVVEPFNGSNFVNEFFLEILMDTFEEGTNKQDWYDVDNFIHDVMDKFGVCSGAETQVRFQDALIDFVRKQEPYNYFGSSGLFIITAELTNWAANNF